jgi:DNA-directed RNA polymerase specialized sigma24 family protein
MARWSASVRKPARQRTIMSSDVEFSELTANPPLSPLFLLLEELPWVKRQRRHRLRTTMSDPTFSFADATPAEVRAHLQRALAREPDAMSSLVDAIAPIIQARVARALLRRQSQAKGRDLRQELEDLMQEVFAALFAHDGRALRAWDPARGLSLLNFVGFIAEREVGMIMRTGKRSPWTEDPTADDKLVHLRGATPSHETGVATRQMLERIAERLREKLTPQGRHYFQLLYVEARPVQIVSQETGVSTEALYAWRSRLGKLLRDLRDELSAEETKESV